MERTLRQVQGEVDDWVQRFEEGYWSPLSMLASLAEELGEVAREVNALEGQKIRKEAEEMGRLETELGGLLFSLVCMANHFGVDLQRALDKAMEKYTRRDFERWTPRKRKA